MNHTLRFAFAAVLCAFAVWWYLRRTAHRTPPPPVDSPAAVDAQAGSPRPPDMPPPSPDDAPPRFRPIDPPRRRALLDRMAAARAAREGGPVVPFTPSAADPAPLPGRLDSDDLLAGIMPLVPSLRACYDETRARRTATSVRVQFKLHLVGDPDLGTLIESAELDGDAAFSADPDLATCLRETLLAVELPPMIGGTTADFTTSMVLTDDSAER